MTEHEHVPPPGPSALRAHGRRLTRQRRLIWDALVARPGAHLTADDVAATLPGVDRSTVYRTLDLLAREGMVERTDLGAGRSFYEPAQEHVHHHVVCERCGAVVHIHDDDLGDLRERVEQASGYRLTSPQRLAFSGRCPACAASD